jgi:hypothetical protein
MARYPRLTDEQTIAAMLIERYSIVTPVPEEETGR